MNLAFLDKHFLFPLPQWLKKHLQFVFSRYTPLHSHIHPYLQITGHIFSNQPRFLSFLPRLPFPSSESFSYPPYGIPPSASAPPPISFFSTPHLSCTSSKFGSTPYVSNFYTSWWVLRTPGQLNWIQPANTMLYCKHDRSFVLMLFSFCPKRFTYFY